MLLDAKPYTFDRVIRIALSIGFLWGFVWLLSYLSDVLIPFAVALLIFPMIMNEIGHMGRILSAVVNDTALAERASKMLPSDLWKTIQDYSSREDVQGLFKTEKFWTIARTVSGKVMPGVWGVITGTASLFMGMVGLIVIGLYLIFLLLDFPKVSQGWKDLLPAPYREGIIEFVQEFEGAMSRHFRAQAAVAAIVGVLFAIGFGIIGLPMGILLGLFIGLLNMVPYLQIIGLFPAILLALVHALETGGNLWMTLGLTSLVFAVVQILQDAILVPKIMGKVTGLSPALILLSVSIWGKLLGMFGLLIALPMTCLILAYYRRLLATAQG